MLLFPVLCLKDALIQDFFYEYLRLLLMQLLLFLTGRKLVDEVHFSFMVYQFLVLDQEVYQDIHLIVLFKKAEILIVLYQLMNYLEKLYKNQQLSYQLVIIHVESQCHHYNYQLKLMIIIKSLQFHFFVTNFNLFSFESDNHMIELSYCTILYCYIKAK